MTTQSFSRTSKLLSLILLFFISFTLSYAGGFAKGNILFKDGTKKEGFVGFFKYYSSKTIKFKQNEDSKPEVIDCNNVERVNYDLGGKIHSFEFRYYYKNAASPEDLVLKKFKVWSYVLIDGPLKLYNLDIVTIKKKGKKYVLVYENTAYIIRKMIRKENEEHLINVLGAEKWTIEMLEYYFPECPEIVEKYKNGGLDNEKGFCDYYTLVNFYNEWWSKKNNKK